MIEKVYYRKMPIAEAILVTEMNIHVVAAWINMKIKEMHGMIYESDAYECSVKNNTLVMLTSDGVNTGNVGDWAVVRSGLIAFLADKDFREGFTPFRCNAGMSGEALYQC